MGAFLVLALVVIVVVAGGFYLVARAGKRQARQRADVHGDPASLHYHPPVGQDPAVVVAELQKAGYVVATDIAPDGSESLLITTDTDRAPDREQVRRVLAGIRQLNFEGDTVGAGRPKFLDE